MSDNQNLEGLIYERVGESASSRFISGFISAVGDLHELPSMMKKVISRRKEPGPSEELDLSGIEFTRAQEIRKAQRTRAHNVHLGRLSGYIGITGLYVHKAVSDSPLWLLLPLATNAISAVYVARKRRTTTETTG